MDDDYLSNVSVVEEQKDREWREKHGKEEEESNLNYLDYDIKELPISIPIITKKYSKKLTPFQLRMKSGQVSSAKLPLMTTYFYVAVNRLLSVREKMDEQEANPMVIVPQQEAWIKVFLNSSEKIFYQWIEDLTDWMNESEPNVRDLTTKTQLRFIEYRHGQKELLEEGFLRLYTNYGNLHNVFQADNLINLQPSWLSHNLFAEMNGMLGGFTKMNYLPKNSILFADAYSKMEIFNGYTMEPNPVGGKFKIFPPKITTWNLNVALNDSFDRKAMIVYRKRLELSNYESIPPIPIPYLVVYIVKSDKVLAVPIELLTAPQSFFNDECTIVLQPGLFAKVIGFDRNQSFEYVDKHSPYRLGHPTLTKVCHVMYIEIKDAENLRDLQM